MKKLLTISIFFLTLPLTAFAMLPASFQATSTTQGWVFPSRISGNEQTIVSQNFIGTSTSLHSTFPYASTTALTVSGALYNTLADGCVQIASNLFTSTGIACGSGSSGSWATSSTDYYLSQFAPFYYLGGLSPAIIATSSSVGFQIGGQTLLATSTGKVGIATTTPWALLSINPNALASGAPSFFVGSSTATGPYFEVNNGGGVQIIGPKTISAGTASTHPLSIIPQTRSDGQSVVYFGIDPNTGLAGTIGVTGSGLNLGDRDQTVLFQEERAGITMNGSGSGGTTGGSTNVKTVNIVPSSYNAYGSELEALHITSQTITEALPFTTQRFNQITQPILTATTSTNTAIGTTSTFYIGGAPRVTASGAASSSIGLLIDPGTATAATTNASSTYGLYVYAPSGGLANYAATFMGGNVGVGSTSPYAALSVDTGNVAVSGASNFVDLINLGTAAGVNPVIKYSSNTVESLPTGLAKNNGSPFFNIAAASGATIVGGGITGESFRRIRFTADGLFLLGGGSVAADTGMARNAAGIIEVNNGTANQLRDITVRSASTTGQTVLATAGGNVGVGTTTPNSLLAIQALSGNFNPSVFTIGSSTAAFATTTLFNVSNTGNVSILGTATVGSTLAVSGGGASAITSAGSIQSNYPFGPGFSAAYSATPSGNGLIGFSTKEFGTSNFWGFGIPATAAGVTFPKKAVIGFQSTGLSNAVYTPIVLFDSAGKVGIGTTSPYGVLNLATSSQPQLVLTDPTAGIDLKHWFQTSQSGSFYLGTVNDALNSTTTYLTIGSTGSVGVGTTSPNWKLSVAGTTTASSFIATSTTEVSNFQQLLATNATTTNFAATTICLTGDTCRTTWPAASGGGGANSKWATTTSPGAYGIYPNGGTGIGVLIGETSSTTNALLEVNGTTTTAGLNITGSATTTSAAGIALSGGCLSVTSSPAGTSCYPYVFSTTTSVAMGTTTISNIPAFDHIRVMLMGSSTNATTLNFQFNGDQAANYSSYECFNGTCSGLANSSWGFTGALTIGGTASYRTIFLDIINAAGMPHHATYQEYWNGGGAQGTGGFDWNSTSRITSISVTTRSTDTYKKGTYLRVEAF